jgi:hypothetical protein
MPPTTRGQKRKWADDQAAHQKWRDQLVDCSFRVPEIPKECLGPRLMRAMTEEVGLPKDLAKLVMQFLPRQSIPLDDALDVETCDHWTRRIRYDPECKACRFCNCQAKQIQLYTQTPQGDVSTTWEKAYPLEGGRRSGKYWDLAKWSFPDGADWTTAGTAYVFVEDAAAYDMYKNIRVHLGEWDA